MNTPSSGCLPLPLHGAGNSQSAVYLIIAGALLLWSTSGFGCFAEGKIKRNYQGR